MTIKSKPATEAYRNNYDEIFRKKAEEEKEPIVDTTLDWEWEQANDKQHPHS